MTNSSKKRYFNKLKITLFLSLILNSNLSRSQGDNCSDAIDLCSITSPYSSSTTGKTNDFSFCSMNSSEDMIFFVDLPAGETITIGQSTNSYDSRHSLRYGAAGGSDCPGVTQIVCTDDPDTQTETWTNTTGVTKRVYWIQAGWSTSDGAFTLIWSFSNDPCTPPTCNDPSALSASNINPNSIDLGWIENGTATTWDIELGTAGFSPTGTPTQNDVTSNPYTYNSLSPSTSYDFYVRADCGGLQSNWIGPFNFTTAACNLLPPNGLSASNITSSSADLSWNENGNSTIWDIEYGISPYSFTGTPNINNTTINPYPLSGLNPSTTYQFKVRAECGGNSVWIGPYSFTTSAVPGSFAVKEVNGWAKGVVQGTDGNLVYVGSRNSDAYVMKVDEAGTLIWAKQYGGTSSEQAYDVVSSSDGGYVIVGSTESTTLNVSGTSGDCDIMITKLDANGNHVWTRVVGRPTDDDGLFQSNTDIVANPDGTFSITSQSYDGGNDMTFIHLSSTGTVLAAKTLNTQTAYGYAITKTTTGWLVGGKMQVGANPYFFVIKLSDTYTEDWSMRWGQNTSTNETIYGVIENGVNDYTVVGQTGEGGGLRMYAMRFNTSGGGTIIWEKTYSQTVTCSANDVVKVGSDIVITGSCAAAGAGDYSDTYLMKINGANGNVIWQTEKPDDGTANRQGDGVCLLSDGSFGVAGLGSFDMLKFAPDGSICGGIPGNTITNDLGTSLSNVDFTEGSVSNIFLVGNASKTPTFTNTGSVVVDCQILPVGLSNFDAICDNKKVICEWTTFSETNNDYFTIEKSTDGIHFQELVKITGAGNSSVVNQYNFIDDEKSDSPSYYRLKQTDYDGKFEYFPMKVADCQNDNAFEIFPNPFTNYINILNDVDELFHDNFIVQDYLGRNIHLEVQSYDSGVRLSFENNLPNGIYFLTIVKNEKIIHTQKIIKHH
ncbi:MAG: fibronectin type III domain-containing protein [Flavobacteriales bacterium]|nr:fibronectin type III domain-containing protein [Flavobacteriales bacterium]MCB9335360.1 fibronectin type III domain-containing protein [Flavobacteriales bacterium]